MTPLHNIVSNPDRPRKPMSSSKRRPQNPSDAERGSPTTSSPSYLSSSSRAPGRKSDYFNYHPPFSILLLEFIVWLFLFFVCFLSPNGGLAAVVKSDDEYVGVLSEFNLFCLVWCDPYLYVCFRWGERCGRVVDGRWRKKWFARC